jgi:hypothetical protein
VVGNVHFEHNPLQDHVKFAQAVCYMERAAKYIRDNKGGARSNSLSTVSDTDSLPFISGGDFNSLPISSGLSAFYNEDIESDDLTKATEQPSVW